MKKSTIILFLVLAQPCVSNNSKAEADCEQNIPECWDSETNLCESRKPSNGCIDYDWFRCLRVERCLWNDALGRCQNR